MARAAPFWAWALSSLLLGLGFTFFSGAVEAWLVDALAYSGYKDKLETVLAKGEIVEGSAMLVGSVAGGFIAQMTSLGVPYLVRAALLVLNFIFALVLMKDQGFKPAKGKHLTSEIKKILSGSIKYGLGNPPVKWMMLAAPFTGGVTIYAFYAMQPYLLELYGDEKAYGVAGLAAAIVRKSQRIDGPVYRQSISQTNLCNCDGVRDQRGGARTCWPGSKLLDGGHAIGVVGLDVCGYHSGETGVFERTYFIRAACDGVIV